MSVTVRVACAADVPVLDRHLPSGRNDVHATFVAKADVTYLAAWSGEEPCGVALIRWAGLRARDPGLAFPGAPEISNLHVRPEWRNRGAGSALIAAAEELAADRGCGHVAIGVDEDNPDAGRLYERLGYTDTGGRWTASYSFFDQAGVERSETEHVRVLVKPLR